VDPLKIYLFKEGLARFSTEVYQQPCKKNLGNLFMHLTNYAINCKNKGKFQFNQGLQESNAGHKRTFSSVLEHIKGNVPEGASKIEKMMR
jgi:tubulin polyglutamylase TTLL6/13